MSLSKYKEYKDSGVEWLGRLPKSWGIIAFRYLFRESNEKIESIILGTMLSVSGYRGVEIKKYEDDNQKRSDEDLVGYRIVRKEQLVVNTMWLNYTGLGVSKYEGYVSPAYRCYWINSELVKPYVHYLLRSKIYVIGYTKYLTGIRPNSLQMSKEDLLKFPVLIPSRDEQFAISSFLDRETSKIDSLIAEQEKLIELLKEKRQAIISHAVTKGLNPDVETKDSGVEWLGKVPVSWKVWRIKHLGKTVMGGTPKTEEPDYWIDGNVPWLPSGKVQNNIIHKEDVDVFITKKALAESAAKLIRSGSALIALTGATCANAAFLTFESTANQSVVGIEPKLNADGCFIYYSLLSQRKQVLIHKSGGAQGGINQEDVRNLVITGPEKAEQTTIAAFLDYETAKIDELTKETFNVIELLKERRSALISAAVTGQIDVRNFVPKEAA